MSRNGSPWAAAAGVEDQRDEDRREKARTRAPASPAAPSFPVPPPPPPPSTASPTFGPLADPEHIYRCIRGWRQPGCHRGDFWIVNSVLYTYNRNARTSMKVPAAIAPRGGDGKVPAGRVRAPRAPRRHPPPGRRLRRLHHPGTRRPDQEGRGAGGYVPHPPPSQGEGMRSRGTQVRPAPSAAVA